MKSIEFIPRYSSINSESASEFKNIPANRNVRVITIDNPSGKPHMEHTKLNTSNRKCIVRHLEPITLSDLDDALCWN